MRVEGRAERGADVCADPVRSLDDLHNIRLDTREALCHRDARLLLRLRTLLNGLIA